MIGIIRKIYALSSDFGRGKLMIFATSTMLLVIASVCAALSVPPLMQMVFGLEDSIQLKGYSFSFTSVLLTFAILQVVLCITNITNEYIKNKYVTSFGSWLRVTILKKIMYREYSFFTHRDGAKVQQVANGYSAQIGMITDSLMDVISKAVVIIGYSIVGLVIDFKLSMLMMVFVMIFYFGFAKGLKPIRARINKELSSAQSSLHSYSMQTIQGVKALRISQKIDIFLKEFTAESQREARAKVLPSLLANFPRYILELILMTGMAIYFFWHYTNGTLINALPSISALVFIAFKVFPLAQGIYSNFTRVITQTFMVDEVCAEYYYKNKEVNSHPLTYHKCISTHGLTFQYDKGSPLLSFPDLEIRKGQVMGIKGVSGSGKSTLLDLILGLYAPTSGKVCVDGAEVSSDQLSGLYSEIGYVGQDTFLLNMSIAENIALETAQNIDESQVLKALELAELREFVEGLPEGTKTMVGDRGIRLSGGQRQRIAIARALYGNPSILLFDEATSALDDETEKKIMETVYNLPKGMTIVLIAHRLSTLEQADHVITLG